MSIPGLLVSGSRIIKTLSQRCQRFYFWLSIQPLLMNQTIPIKANIALLWCQLMHSFWFLASKGYPTSKHQVPWCWFLVSQAQLCLGLVLVYSWLGAEDQPQIVVTSTVCPDFCIDVPHWLFLHPWSCTFLASEKQSAVTLHDLRDK